ncbi:MAG: ABC transporter ATP-binding protein [Oscillospiraceae bacterium]|nr:ABC transporter ATP-binding protein [Oscillospiraceae bacterium]
MSHEEPLVRVENLCKTFKTNFGTLLAVDNVDFTINKGEVFGLVGESGSGKSTIGSMLVGMYNATSGTALYRQEHNIGIKHSERSKWLKQDIQLVFQDPGSSLNPRKSVRQILGVPIDLFSGEKLTYQERNHRIEASLARIGLPPEYLDKYPRSIGGGEKQLICVARALSANPSFIVLDEPTSALDVSIQAKITNKLLELQQKDNLSYLFITHNLCLVRNICDRIAIMYLGKICEMAPTQSFFNNPLHPYTQMLLASIPVLAEEEEKLKPQRIRSTGEIPSPLNKPKGCSFHPRCPHKNDICTQIEPQMAELSPNHFVSCHLLGA